MKIALLVLVFIALGSAQNQKPCQLPSQWQTSLVVGTDGFNINNPLAITYYLDQTHNQWAYQLVDYEKGQDYQISVVVVNGKTYVSITNFAVCYYCNTPNAKFPISSNLLTNFQYVAGITIAPNVPANVFAFKNGTASVTAVVTQQGCIPTTVYISSSNTTEVSGFQSIFFFNQSPKISNPNIFTPPAKCPQGSSSQCSSGQGEEKRYMEWLR